MHSHLTRSVFRQLLSSRGLVIHCRTRSAFSLCRHIRDTAPHSSRWSQRRTFWGFSRQVERKPKEAKIAHGLGKMAEVTQLKKMGARGLTPDEMAKAWRSFFQYKAGKQEAVNRLQAEHALNTFQALKSMEPGTIITSLTIKELRGSMRVLVWLPKDGKKDLHNELARLLYAEILQMESVKEEDRITDLRRYCEILAKTGDTLEAREQVLNYCKTLQGLDAPGLELTADASITNSSLWLVLLKGFAKDRNSAELIRTWDMAENYGLPYKKQVHKLMTNYFADENDVNATKLWFNKPIANSEDNARPSPLCLKAVLKFCIRNNELEWCTAIFKDILSSNPSKNYWDIVLQWAAGALGKGVEDVERMMEIMVQRNPDDELIRPDVATINGLVELAISLNEPYLAERYISLGAKWGIRPNAQTYILQMEYRADANDLSGAQAAYDALQAEEILHNDDLPAVNKYIRALCASKSDNYNLITSVLTDVEERDTHLEPETVVSLCRMYLHRQENENLVDLLQTNMYDYTIDERAQIRDAFVTFCLDPWNSTLKSWLAYNIIRQFVREMDVTIRTKLMNEFFRRRRSDMATHVFGHMRQHDNPIRRPLLETYVDCLEGIAKYKDREHLDMVHNMLKLDSSIEPNTKLYNALMLAYTACGDADRASMFWNDITASFEGPSYNSLEIIFWACSRMPFGEKKAREIWSKMRRMQVEVTKEVFAAYLGAIAHVGLWDEAREMVEGMGKEFGLEMDKHILGSLYNTLHGQQRRDVCEQWAGEHHPDVLAELKQLGRVRRRDTGERSFMLKIERRA